MPPSTADGRLTWDAALSNAFKVMMCAYLHLVNVRQIDGFQHCFMCLYCRAGA